MKYLHYLNNLLMAQIFWFVCSIFCLYSVYDTGLVFTQTAFTVVAGASTIVTIFSLSLPFSERAILKNHLFYTRWSLAYYVLGVVLLLGAFLKPDAIIFNFFVLAFMSVSNMLLMGETLGYRKEYSLLIENIYLLFPEQKIFKFDLDFNNEHCKNSADPSGYRYERTNPAIKVYTSFGPLVFASSFEIYFDGFSCDAKQFSKMLKELDVDFKKATPADIKNLEMLIY